MPGKAGESAAGNQMERHNMDRNTTFLKRWSSLFILLGAVLWSTNAPFFKILQVDAYLAVFIRASIAGVILLPTLRPRQLKWDASLLIMLLSYTGLCIGVVLAIRSTSTNIATGLQYTAPVWIFLLSWWRGKTKFSWRAHWPLLVLLAGLVVSMCSGSSAVTVRGNLIALSTSLFFTAMTLSSKKTAADNPLGMVSLTNLFCAAVTLAFFVPRPLGQHLAAITPTEWVILVYLGVFQIAAGYALYYIGLRYTEPARAAMIAPCEMVLGPVWVAIFVREYPDWIGAAGSLLILAGVISEEILSQRRSVLPRRRPAQNSTPSQAQWQKGKTARQISGNSEN